MGYYGEDGQLYDTLDQLRGANNRYRQQQEQNRLLKEQNDFMKKEKEREEQEKRAASARERRDSIIGRLRDFMDLFNFSSEYSHIDNYAMLRQFLLNKIKIIEFVLKSEIDNLSHTRKNITTNDNEGNISDFDNFFNDSFEKFFKEYEEIFLVKIDMLKSFIDKRKSENISFENEVFENMYNNVLSYANSEFRKVGYTPNFVFDESKSKHWGGYIDLFKDYKKSILEYVETEKRELLNFQEEQKKKVYKLKDNEEDIDKKIKEVNNRINQLNNSTTLKNIDEVKSIIADVDYDFLKEIIGNNYSLEEIVLLIKGHIKQVELEIPKLENQKNYYKILLYLTENITYSYISDYEEFDESIDYKKEYDRIIKFENDKKEEEKKLEQQRKIKEEENRKLEKERIKREEKIKEEKIKEEERIKLEKKRPFIIATYRRKNFYKVFPKIIDVIFGGATILFIVLSIVMSWMYIPMALLSLALCFIFNIAFKPEKVYSREVRGLGFKNIEEFEKVAIKLIESKNKKK